MVKYWLQILWPVNYTICHNIYAPKFLCNQLKLFESVQFILFKISLLKLKYNILHTCRSRSAIDLLSISDGGFTCSGFSRIFSIINVRTAIIASLPPEIKHTLSVVPEIKIRMLQKRNLWPFKLVCNICVSPCLIQLNS